MSVEKNRSVVSLTLFLVAFAACGVETTPVAEEQAPLVPAVEAPVQNTPARLTPTENVARLRASKLTQLTELQGPRDVVVAHSLAAPDGTQVEFMMGMVGCGIMVIASGTATVTGGTFEIPYDPASNEFGLEATTLYFRVAGAGACDDANPNVFEAAAPLPGSADLSQAQPSYAGCWLFQNP